MQAKAAPHQAFHHRPMRRLDCDMDLLRPRTRDRENPVRHRGQAGAAMQNAARPQLDPGCISHMDLVFLRGPIDSDKPTTLMLHVQLLSVMGHPAMPADPCTGAQRRNSPPGFHRGRLAEALLRLRRSRRRTYGSLSASWPTRNIISLRAPNRYRDLCVLSASP